MRRSYFGRSYFPSRRREDRALVVGSVASGIAADAQAIERAGLPWRHAFFAEIAKFPSAVLAARYPDVPNLGDMTRITPQDIEDSCEKVRSTSSSADFRASPSPLPAYEVEWLTTVVNWPSSSADLLSALGQHGLSQRMSQVCSPQTEVKPSGASSLRWMNSGTAWRGEYKMRNTTDSRNDASACSLSAILETGDLPQRYFLTPRACAGILRRAERRGRVLPEALAAALRAVAERSPDPSEPPAAEDAGIE